MLSHLAQRARDEAFTRDLARRISSYRGASAVETLEGQTILCAVLYWSVRQRWDLATDPGPIPPALRTLEVTTGRVTVYAIPPRLRPLIGLKGQARRARR
jgi:hypothetical protein